ncbi:hypothetical protein CITRIK5_20171 [Citricoccus sp. K5]|nr:hypothetical protein CITRIK5_20171 [Citricoccus sp. K5]
MVTTALPTAHHWFPAAVGTDGFGPGVPGAAGNVVGRRVRSPARSADTGTSGDGMISVRT